MQVDPENRLVADQLEADWNNKLRTLHRVQEEYERQKEADRKIFSSEQRQRILSLAAEFPKVWNDPCIADRERKRMVPLLLEDVTLHKGDNIVVQVRFKGGALHTLELPRPLPFCVVAKTKPEVIEEIDRLLGDHTHEEILKYSMLAAFDRAMAGCLISTLLVACATNPGSRAGASDCARRVCLPALSWLAS
jgi:hypothetical protein